MQCVTMVVVVTIAVVVVVEVAVPVSVVVVAPWQAESIAETTTRAIKDNRSSFFKVFTLFVAKTWTPP